MQLRPTAHTALANWSQCASVRHQSGLSESDGSDLSADYSFLSTYSILLILHLKFSLAHRVFFFLTDVYSKPEMIWSVSLPTGLLKSCSHLSNNAIWIPEYVCSCDLLRFFLWFLGSVLVMCIRLFFCPSLLFSFHSGTFQSLGNGFHSDRNCRQGECAETGMWTHWHSHLMWSAGLPPSFHLICKMRCYICLFFKLS